MLEDDDTVNTTTSKARYHHGDLRSSLIAEGLKRLDAGPVEALSMRELARNVGVSATAVYRHFPDKGALISALCEEGDAQLETALRTALKQAKPGQVAFNAMGRAYVQYALAHPSLFRLMMTNTLPTEAGKPDSTGTASMTIMSNALDDLVAPDTSPSERNVRRLKAWSLVHGLAMLILDGKIPPDTQLIESIIDGDNFQ